MSRKAMAFAAGAIGAYLTTLVATAPADILLPRPAAVERFGGTIWHGEAALTGGNRIAWDWAPLRSLGALGFAADWRATGTGTDLSGGALLRPTAMRLDGVAGRADGTLLAALAPDLPFTCDIGLTADLPLVAIGGAAPALVGEVRSDGGTCRPATGGIATPAPPLLLVGERFAGTSRIVIAPLGQRRTRFVEARIADGRLDLTITPAGARALPFAAPNSGVRMSMDL